MFLAAHGWMLAVVVGEEVGLDVEGGRIEVCAEATLDDLQRVSDLLGH